MKIILPDYVRAVTECLRRNGFEAYAVGGCVRDFLLGAVPDDYDLCTDALPEDVIRCFSKNYTVPTGLKHGTVTVISDGHNIEVTTYRIDGQYTDCRHPDTVSFSRSLRDDLKRRDFTVNAIAYSDINGLTDLYGGVSDLENGIIRCVGDPKERFSEDPLRIMRAVRFASKLGFTVEPETENAIFAMKDLLEGVSCERISTELKKAVTGKYFESVLNRFAEVFCVFIPELIPSIGYDQNSPHHDFSLSEHLAKTVSFCPDDVTLRIAALLHDISKPETETKDKDGISHFIRHAHFGSEKVKIILSRLKFSNTQIEKIVNLIRYHDGVIEETESSVKHRLNQLGEEQFLSLISLQRADDAAQKMCGPTRTAHYDRIIEIYRKIVSEKECFSLSNLAVNGSDMISLGLKGREIGDALNMLLNKVIESRLENDKQVLTDYIKSKLN